MRRLLGAGHRGRLGVALPAIRQTDDICASHTAGPAQTDRRRVTGRAKRTEGDQTRVAGALSDALAHALAE